jgi:hypothetical protein
VRSSTEIGTSGESGLGANKFRHAAFALSKAVRAVSRHVLVFDHQDDALTGSRHMDRNMRTDFGIRAVQFRLSGLRELVRESGKRPGLIFEDGDHGHMWQSRNAAGQSSVEARSACAPAVAGRAVPGALCRARPLFSRRGRRGTRGASLAAQLSEAEGGDRGDLRNSIMTCCVHSGRHQAREDAA